ncbi:MAG TPA: hypothetical protein VLF67_02000, partial [Candidatus Saccharimonas sp.]|nr:hypothetical protein [Candidatus Saccharimonas sp.]
DMPAECDPDNSITDGTPVAPAPGASCGDSINCAKLILAEPDRVSFGTSWDASTGTYRPDAVRHDLEIVAAGNKIQNADSCNNPVVIHPMLLNALYQASLKYTIEVDSFVTTHGGTCDPGFYHPQGRAMDIYAVNGIRTAIPSLGGTSGSIALDTEFAEYIAQFIPANGEILQATKCFPFDTQKYPQMDVGRDTCDHVHVSVGAVQP